RRFGFFGWFANTARFSPTKAAEDSRTPKRWREVPSRRRGRPLSTFNSLAQQMRKSSFVVGIDLFFSELLPANFQQLFLDGVRFRFTLRESALERRRILVPAIWISLQLIGYARLSCEPSARLQCPPPLRSSDPRLRPGTSQRPIERISAFLHEPSLSVRHLCDPSAPLERAYRDSLAQTF